jgi:hypothetical protein
MAIDRVIVAINEPFRRLCETGYGSLPYDPTMAADDDWLADVAEPFWRAMAAQADRVGLPVVCDIGVSHDWDASASVWLTHRWTRAKEGRGPEGFWSRRDESVRDAWDRTAAAGPPAGSTPTPAEVDDAYQTLITEGYVLSPAFRWDGPLRRLRRRRWRRREAAPWLAALVARADADGRPVLGDVVWPMYQLAYAGSARLRLLDQETRRPLRSD